MSSVYDNAEHCVCCGAVIPEGRQVCVICGKKAENVKQRQIDRIRNMSVEKMAEELAFRVICSCCPCKKLCEEHNGIGCVEVFRIWLESEVDTE